MSALTEPPAEIERLLAVRCMNQTCHKTHCRGCWQGEKQQPGGQLPTGCIRPDSCTKRRLVAIFEALRNFDEHYLRFCSGDPLMPALHAITSSNAGRYLALQPSQSTTPGRISRGLAAFVHTLRIAEFYLDLGQNGHEESRELPPALRQILDFSFLSQVIEEILSPPYSRIDIWQPYEQVFCLVLRFLRAYEGAFPGSLNLQRWGFLYSCGIGMYMRNEGDIEWARARPSFFQVVWPIWESNLSDSLSSSNSFVPEVLNLLINDCSNSQH